MRTNHFGSVGDEHAVIASIRGDVLDSPLGARHTAEQVDRCIEHVVTGLWMTSRIKTFIPVLASREVRARLQATPPSQAEIIPYEHG